MYRVISHGEPLPLQQHNFREKKGIDIVWRGGDVIRPLNGHWFSAPWPTLVIKVFCPWRILPLVRWRLGEPPHQTTGYAGFKAFGVDISWYEYWLDPEEVIDGSVALTPSWRWDADDH